MAMTSIEKEWINDNAVLMQAIYPNVSREKIDKILKNILKENIKKTPIVMRDTYRDQLYHSNTIDLTEFCKKAKPLMAGNGVLIDRDAYNPAIQMLDEMKYDRDYFKKQMKSYPSDSYEFAQNNLYQGNEKVKMNAWYNRAS